MFISQIFPLCLHGPYPSQLRIKQEVEVDCKQRKEKHYDVGKIKAWSTVWQRRHSKWTNYQGSFQFLETLAADSDLSWTKMKICDPVLFRLVHETWSQKYPVIVPRLALNTKYVTCAIYSSGKVNVVIFLPLLGSAQPRPLLLSSFFPFFPSFNWVGGTWLSLNGHHKSSWVKDILI